MADDIFYMKQALAEAEKASARGEVPVGAVIVCQNRIIARAHNLTETLNDVTAHAEMQAGAIAWAQVGKLVFGAEDEKRGYMRYAPAALHPKTEVVSGTMKDECADLMKEFFRKRR